MTTTQPLLAELLGLLGDNVNTETTAGPPPSEVSAPPKSRAAVVPDTTAPPLPPEQSHAPTLTPLQHLASVGVVDIGTARDERNALRDSLTPKALRAAHLAIDVIAQTFEAKGGDFDDAVRALPVLHRVLEHVERLEVAKKTSATSARASLVIVLDDAVPQVSPPRRARHANVVDVTAGDITTTTR